MSTPMSKKLRTPEFRASFLHIFEKEDKPDGTEGPFSLVAMFPKKSADWRQDLPWLWEGVKEALLVKYPGGQNIPGMFKEYGVGTPWPIKDGDAPNTRGTVREEAKGHWLVRMVSGNFDPRVNLLDGRSKTLGTLTKSTCFSGCYFEATGKVLYYDKGASMGLTFGMDNLMMTREGESFGGGGGNAGADFGVEVQNAPAATDFGTPGDASAKPAKDPFAAGDPAGSPDPFAAGDPAGSPDPFGTF